LFFVLFKFLGCFVDTRPLENYLELNNIGTSFGLSRAEQCSNVWEIQPGHRQNVCSPADPLPIELDLGVPLGGASEPKHGGERKKNCREL
jgi:hypothetical protein